MSPLSTHAMDPRLSSTGNRPASQVSSIGSSTSTVAFPSQVADQLASPLAVEGLPGPISATVVNDGLTQAISSGPENNEQQQITHDPANDGVTLHAQQLSSSENDDTRPPSSIQGASCQIDSKTPAHSWWWWWEIAAAVLSLICIAVIITFLVKIDDTPLTSWSLPITPNSLISVVSTLGKSAMMVPVVACLSQLKWRHFHVRPHKLSNLQVFDDASRGPWGSIGMLFKLGKWAPLGRILAVITILALGFEPSAQQILVFGPKRVQMVEKTPLMGTATEYTSKGLDHNQFQFAGDSSSMEALSIQLAVLNGAVGTVFPPNFSCPDNATDCEWDDFTSLGLCGEFRNITAEKAHSCRCLTCQNGGVSWDIGLKLNCFYGLKYQIDHEPAQGVPMFYVLSTGRIMKDPKIPTAPSTLFRSLKSNDGLSIVIVKVIGGGLHHSDGETPNVTDITNSSDLARLPKLPKTELYTIKWSWCAKTFRNITALPNRLRTGLVESMTLDGKSHTQGSPWKDFSNPLTGEIFHVDTSTETRVIPYLYDVFNVTAYDRIHLGDLSDAQRQFDIGPRLYGADLANFTNNIAEVLTNQIRSKNPGDNFNATMIPGRAFREETYIHVRWQWLTLPLSETLLTTCLLGTSIYLSKSQGLWKASPLALLFLGLEGWTEEERSVTVQHTSEELESMAKGMRAEITEGTNGVEVFRKAC